MRVDGTIERSDVERAFRARLATKLAARGYAGAELEQKIDELLRKGLNLRLNIAEITGVQTVE
jgi:hypothetical protein